MIRPCHVISVETINSLSNSLLEVVTHKVFISQLLQFYHHVNSSGCGSSQMMVNRNRNILEFCFILKFNLFRVINFQNVSSFLTFSLFLF